MNTITLIGADDVRSAGHTISSAAHAMQQAAYTIQECTNRLEQLFGRGYGSVLDQLIEALNKNTEAHENNPTPHHPHAV